MSNQAAWNSPHENQDCVNNLNGATEARYYIY